MATDKLLAEVGRFSTFDCENFDAKPVDEKPIARIYNELINLIKFLKLTNKGPLLLLFIPKKIPASQN